jgi:hypothetical protein
MTEKPSASRAIVDVVRTHAERLEQDAEERLHQRQRALAEQSSTAHTPAVRIRIWERVHALRMPGDAAHPVLEVIAFGTGLTLEQIREEQRTRVALRSKRETANSAGVTQIP